jgi:acyl-CoA reductase-like NAD-dependent aldehyde dehydrogenase
VAKVAPDIFSKAMFNTGQVCVAIKRLFVHESQYDEMVAALASEARKAKVGNGLSKGIMYGPINNKMQFDRVKGLVDDAVRSGATVAAGGVPIALDGGYYFAPTVLSNVHEGMRVVDEEQFGPVLPVLKYDHHQLHYIPSAQLSRL